MSTFIKVRFTSKQNGSTAGLVIPTNTFFRMHITDVSRLFLISEATKMGRLQWSQEYDNWNDAFFHNLDATDAVNRGGL